MTIGDKIKTHRKALGLTQTELGERLGVKVNAVSKWECGRVEDIPTSKIKALAQIFGVKPSYLIDDDAPTLEEKNDAPELSESAEKLLNVIPQLTPENQKLLLEVAKGFLQNRQDD